MTLQGVTFKDAAIVVYLVMFVVMAVLVWLHVGGDRRYRTIFAVVLGIFWPLPAAILIYLWIHAMFNAIADWLERFKD